MSYNYKALLNLKKNGSTHISQPSPVDPKAEENREPIAYKDYINSVEWGEMRIQSSKVWGNACLCCGNRESIERHHLFYRHHVEKASPFEIIPLCRTCHEAAHTDGANKNSQPFDMEALNGIINRLFHKIVRGRRFPTSIISKCHDAFWAVFRPHTKILFGKREPKIKKVKTKYKLRPGHNKRKGKHWKKRNGKLKGFSADERVAKANKGGRSFRIYPQFKTVKNYAANQKSGEFVPTYNLIKAEKPIEVDNPSQSQ